MRKDYYNPMRNLAIIVPFLAATLFSDGPAAQQPQTTMKAASVEAHEGVTISARPWTDAATYKAKFQKKSPLAAGIVAIDTIVRNDSDESMKVDLEQIRLNVIVSEDNRQALRSLTPDDVADVMTDTGRRDPTAKHRVPFPIPSTGQRVGRDRRPQPKRPFPAASLPLIILYKDCFTSICKDSSICSALRISTFRMCGRWRRITPCCTSRLTWADSLRDETGPLFLPTVPVKCTLNLVDLRESTQSATITRHGIFDHCR